MNDMTTQPQYGKLLTTVAEDLVIEPGAFKSLLEKTIMPQGATAADMAAFLLVARKYGLNPVTGEIHAFKSGNKIRPMVGIDGWITLAQQHPQFDGIEFTNNSEAGEIVSCTAQVWRKDHSRPTIVTEYMSECRRDTMPWQRFPRRMLRHKAAIQAIRYAFGFSGIQDEDEAALSGSELSVPSQGNVSADIMRQVHDEQREAVNPPWEEDSVGGQAIEIAKEFVKKSAKEIVEEAIQYPVKTDDGWIDAEGTQFDADVHGMSRDGTPSVTKANLFRRKRNTSPEQRQETVNSEPESVEGPTYPEIRSAIQTAKNEDDLGMAADLLRGFAGPADLFEELNKLLESGYEAAGLSLS